MTNDPFEDFVKDHRDEFDDLVPADDLFKGIKTKKGRIVSMNSKTWFIRVAAAMVIFSIGFTASEIISTIKEGGQSTTRYSQNSEDLDSAESSFQDFYEIQMYYTQQIDLVKNEIILLSNADEEINQEVNFELDELKSIFNELQRDLEDHANNQEVIDAMIMNYRVKLKMLEEMKNQLDPSINNNEEDNYETVDI